MKLVIPGWSPFQQLIIVAFLIVLLLTTLVACTSKITNNATLTATSTKEIIPVEQLLQNPKNYPGLLCVEGIVSEVSMEQKMFTLIDTQEFLLCGATGCAVLTLPVQWSEKMPSIEDAVQVIGEVYYQDRKLVFIGQKLNITHRK